MCRIIFMYGSCQVRRMYIDPFTKARSEEGQLPQTLPSDMALNLASLVGTLFCSGLI